MRLEGRPAYAALELPRVGIESSQRIQLVRALQTGLTHRLLEHPQRLVVDLDGDGKRMPVLAPMRE